MWLTRQFSQLQSGEVAFTWINMEGMDNGHILQYMFGESLNFVHCFQGQIHTLTFVFGTVLIGWNQTHIFDNDNFSIIPKSIFFDNDNLTKSFKNVDISAIDNFFDNIAHPYMGVPQLGWSLFPGCLCKVQFSLLDLRNYCTYFYSFLSPLRWLLLVVRDSKGGTEK